MRQSVRIVVVGDEHVGKTSLISNLVNDAFLEEVPPVLAEVSIPSEVTPDNIPTYIIDTSSRAEHKDVLEMELQRADVVVLVYALNDPRSYGRLRTHWLPLFRSLGLGVPIMLICNKIDSKKEQKSTDIHVNLDDNMLPMMEEYKEIETCIECSAKNMMNVTEIFYFAMKSVLHPTSPLYDPKEQELKPTCADALSRIFHLCDTNKDGAMDEEELQAFQIRCFDTPLMSNELEGVKEIVSEFDRTGVNALGLTESGFRTLNLLFIQRGRPETTWTILRKFGYEDDLSLAEDYLYPKLEVPSDGSVELSGKGNQLFLDLFKKFDRDSDAALRWAELQELFATSPGNPWLETAFPEGTLTNHEGAVTQFGFLLQWIMTTLIDPTTTLAYLAYLGYPGDTRTAVQVTRSRKLDAKKGLVTRSVFLAYVVGPEGSGKTSLLRRLVNKPLGVSYPPASRTSPYVAINSIEHGHVMKYLVLQEVPASDAKGLLSDPSKMEKADLVVFLYDSHDPNSFVFIATLCRDVKLEQVPVVLLATKSDLEAREQRYPIPPNDFCRQRHWLSPIPISVHSSPSDVPSLASKELNRVYHRLIDVAMNPSSSMPPPPRKPLRTLLVISTVLTGLAILSYVGVKVMKHYKSAGTQ